MAAKLKDTLIKINFVKINEERKFLFPNNFLVSQVIEYSRNKIKKDIGGANYRLYAPKKDNNNPGVWLKEDMPLSFYEARINMATLQFKNTETTVKIWTPDLISHEFEADITWTLGQMVRHVCLQLEITIPEEYGLIKYTPHPEQHYDGVEMSTLKARLFIPAFLERKAKIKKPHIPELWEACKNDFLDEMVLVGEDEGNNEGYLLRKRYIFSDHFVDIHHPVYLKYNFFECVQRILGSCYCVELDDMCDLAILFLQYLFGEYSEKAHKNIDSAFYLPLEFLNDKHEKKAKKKVMESWAKAGKERISEELLMFHFMEKTHKIKDYGTTYFYALETIKKGKSQEHKVVAFGFSRANVTMTDSKHRKIKHQWPLNWVKSHGVSNNFLTLDFGDHADEWLNVMTPNPLELLKVIKGYIQLNLIKKKVDPSASSASHNLQGLNVDLALLDPQFAVEENISVVGQQAVVSKIEFNKTPLVIEDAAIGMEPGYELISNLFTPKAPPCVANALNIIVKIDQAQIEQLSQEVDLASAALGLDSGIDVGMNDETETNQFLDVLFTMDTDEKQWRLESLTVCRQNVRKFLTPLMHSLVVIFEQFSCLHGEVDTAEVFNKVQIVCDRLSDFVSGVRLTATLLEDPPEVPLLAICKEMAETIRTIFQNLPKKGQEIYDMGSQLLLLDKIAECGKQILSEIKAEKINPSFQEEVSWLGNNVLTGCHSLLFTFIDKLLISLKNQSIPSKVISDTVTKAYISVRLLTSATNNLALLLFDKTCKEMVIDLANNSLYQVDILESTAKVNVSKDQMLSLLEYNAASVRGIINKLLTTVDSVNLEDNDTSKGNNNSNNLPSPFLPDIVQPATPELTSSNLSAEEAVKSRSNGIEELLKQISLTIDSNSANFGDPAVPIKLSRTLNDAVNALIQELRKAKKGRMWEQLIQDITAHTSELANAVNVFGLSLMEIEIETDIANDNEQQKETLMASVEEAIEQLMGDLNEITLIWTL